VSATAVRLQLGLVGEQARYDRYASAFGQAARLATVNVFEPSEYFSGLGLRIRREEDLSQVLTFSLSRQEALASTLEIPVTPTWDLKRWIPFELRHVRLDQDWKFRYCAACLLAGFHTLLFQLPWIHSCPWHRQRLHTGCDQCGRPNTVSGAEGRTLLQCVCGHAAINAVTALTPNPTLEAARSRFLEEYLSWAAQQRATTTVIAPCSGHANWQRLAMAVRLPLHLSLLCQDPGLGAWPVPVDTLRVLRAAPEWEAAEVLRAFRPLSRDDPGVMELPDCMSLPFRAAAQHVAMALPPGSLTDREMSLFFPGLSGERARKFKPARRKSSSDLGFVPPQRIGGRSFLHLHTIAPTTLRSAWAVLQEAAGGGIAGRIPLDKRIAAAASIVAARMLTRGYVEGMRLILAHHVPALLDDARLRPRHSEPWVWMRRDLAGLQCAIHWSGEPLID